MKFSEWELLKIEPTTDKKIIQKAYSNQLPKYHPEDDPEGFARLKEAYQAAIVYAKQQSLIVTKYDEDNFIKYETKEKTQLDTNNLYEQLEQAIRFDIDYPHAQWKLLCDQEEENREQWQNFLNKKNWKPFTVTIDLLQELFTYEYQKSYNHSSLIAGKIYMFLNLKDLSYDDEIVQRFQIMLKQDAQTATDFLTWKRSILQFCAYVQDYSKHNYAIEEWQKIIQRYVNDSTILELRYHVQLIISVHSYSEPVWRLLENTFQVQLTNTSFLAYKPTPIRDAKRQEKNYTTYIRNAIVIILVLSFLLLKVLNRSMKTEQLEIDHEMQDFIQDRNQDYLNEQNNKMKDYVKDILEKSNERTE